MKTLRLENPVETLQERRARESIETERSIAESEKAIKEELANARQLLRDAIKTLRIAENMDGAPARYLLSSVSVSIHTALAKFSRYTNPNF